MDKAGIREALDRITADDAFGKSKRSAGLLRYIVEEALAGRADRLKGATIAQDVFGRDETFESNVDPIVRVQAGRLRRFLQDYYQGPGASDPLVISIPKGGYAPKFETRAAAGPSPGSARIAAGEKQAFAPFRRLAIGGALAALVAALFVAAGLFQNRSVASALQLPDGPRIFVSEFSFANDDAVAAAVAKGFQIELIDRLSRFKNLFVFGPDTVIADDGAAWPGKAGGERPKPEFILSGSIGLADDRFNVTSQLLDVSQSIVVWSQNFENIVAAPGELADVEMAIVSDVAAAVGQPYGVINSYMKRMRANVEDVSFADYLCLLQFYDYAREKSESGHASIRDCLESATKRTPNWSMGWAALSWIYGDEDRYGYNRRADPPPFERALQAAKAAVAADPYNATAHEYLSVAWFMQGADADANEAAEKSLSLNPNDSESLAWASSVFMALENSARGRAMAEKALALNPGHPPWFHHGLAIYHYRNGEYDEALLHASAYHQDNSALSNVLLTASYVRRGRLDEARAQWDDLRKTYPEIAEDPGPMLRAWRLPKSLIDKLNSDLEDARGLSDNVRSDAAAAPKSHSPVADGLLCSGS